MTRPPLTQLHATPAAVGDPGQLADLVNRVQRLVLEALRYLFGLPLSLGQNLVTGVALTTSATAVQHGLGRRVQGYLVVRSTAGVTVHDADTTTPTTTISLTASGSATVDILFF